jgi:hypothetical protein
VTGKISERNEAVKAELRQVEITQFQDAYPGYIWILLVEGEHITDTIRPGHAELLQRIADKLNEDNEEKD